MEVRQAWVSRQTGRGPVRTTASIPNTPLLATLLCGNSWMSHDPALRARRIQESERNA
jgi:hypothetical protein